MATLLVIDDEEDFRVVVGDALSGRGHRVLLAKHGAEGLRIARNERIDLVLTDLVMPEKEGIETIRELREDFPALRIIAVSGGGRAGGELYLAMAAELGADFVLQKPFAMATMLENIDRLLARPDLPGP